LPGIYKLICLANPVAEKDKIQAGGYTGQDNETKGQVRSQLSHPDGVEWVLELDPPLTHVKDEEAEATK
jgi:hypothetical protein